MADDKPDLSEVAEALGGAPAQESKPTEESSAERKLREDREAFAKITAKGKEPEEKPKKAAEPKEQSTPEEPEPEEKPAQEPPEETQAEKPEETDESRKARDFLRLKQAAPPGVIDTLSPTEAEEWHSMLARRESEIDRTYRELAELRKQTEEKGEPTKAEPVVPAVEVDFEPLKSRLKEALGSDESEGITAAIEAAIKQAVEPYATHLSELDQTIQDERRRNTKALSDANRKRLSDRIPVLSESDTAWNAVEQAVIQIAQSDPSRYRDAEGYFNEAATSIYGKESLNGQDKQAKEEERETKKQNVEASTPEVTSRRPPQRKLTPQESQYEVFKHLGKNPGDIRGARRAGRVKGA
jgi:hypothetical protein